MRSFVVMGRYQPIAFINNILLVKQKEKLCLLYNGAIVKTYRIPISYCHRLKSITRISQRLFRTEVRTALVNKNNVYMFMDRALYNFNIEGSPISKIYTVDSGKSTPLNIGKALSNDEYVAYFGDYSSNSEQNEVNIYGINNSDCVSLVHTFPPKCIRHIHNIVPDEYRDGYWILTGDNEEKAGIWFASKNFDSVEPILTGKTEARAVVAFPTEKGLLFATDSVMNQNRLCMLKRKSNTWDIEYISDMDGSCIYGAISKNGLLLSTTVESAENTGKRGLFSVKPAPGIKDDYVKLCFIDSNCKVTELLRLKKDKLPYKLFQYGTFRFLANQIESPEIFVYPMAVKHYDGKLLRIGM